MPTIKAIEFDRHVKPDESGQPSLHPVYAFVGPDTALMSGCLAALRATVETDDQPGGMVTDVDGEALPAAVFDELRTQPFMGMAGLRLVIVRRGTEFLADHTDALGDYLQKPSSTGVLALCCEKLDGRTSIAKTIARRGATVSCTAPSWPDARAWLKAECQRRRMVLSPGAGRVLMDAVGNNVVALTQELDKLELYAADADTVTEQHVDDLVPASRSRSIFDLANAIMRGDEAVALRMARDQLLRGDRPEGVVGFLGRQIRSSWRISRMAKRGMRQKEIEKATGMRDFAVSRTITLVQGLPERWFAERIAVLSKADEELKTMSLPTREHVVWLSALVVRLCR